MDAETEYERAIEAAQKKYDEKMKILTERYEENKHMLFINFMAKVLAAKNKMKEKQEEELKSINFNPR